MYVQKKPTETQIDFFKGVRKFKVITIAANRRRNCFQQTRALKQPRKLSSGYGNCTEEGGHYSRPGRSIRNLNGRLNYLSTDLHFSKCARVARIDSVGSSQSDKFNRSWRTANQVLVSLGVWGAPHTLAWPRLALLCNWSSSNPLMKFDTWRRQGVRRMLIMRALS